MIYLDLFLTFARVGLFTFGGGYGMIPLIQEAVTQKGWLDAETLYQYIGICESTPGPIAVNMATFIGASQAGIAGSACATLGVVLPSFIIILLIAAVLKNFRKNPHVRAALAGITPVVAGMITATGLCAALECLGLTALPVKIDHRQFVIAMGLAALTLVWRKVLKKPFSPILLILCAAVTGALVY